MYNLTNYSLLFLSEIKYRFYYFLLSFLCILLLCIYNFNFLLIQLLYPLDRLYLDISFKLLSFFFFDFIFKSFSDLFNMSIYTFSNLDTISSSFDHYPLFEINLSNNKLLYFYILFYFLFLFLFPILLYHMYLFIIPSLYLNEYVTIKSFILFFIFFLYFYFFFIHSNLISFFINFNYNQFQEFYNYEFDIEFNFLDYLVFYIQLWLTVLLSIFYGLSLMFYITNINHLFYLKYSLYIFFFFFSSNFFYFIIFIFFLYFLNYLWLIKFFIKRNFLIG